MLLASACAGGAVVLPSPRGSETIARLNPLAALLDSAIAARAATGGVVAVSWHGARFIYGTGKLALDDPRRPDGHSVYDLASLTKVIATTTLAMQAVEEGHLDLDRPVQHYLPAFRGPGKERVTVRHLLTHSSGLRADSPLWRQTPNPDSALRLRQCDATRYGAGRPDGVLRHGGHRARPGDRAGPGRSARPAGPGSHLQPARDALHPLSTAFVLDPPDRGDRIRHGWRSRIVRGEVHDEKAAWLRGVAGHAGLFGSALDC